MDKYDPFIVGEGVYALKFTSADQKIYFEFQADEDGVYKVYSVGSVDASVTQLTGTKMTGIQNTGDPAFKNDNVSATDKNFALEFEVSPALLVQDDGSCYFEIALENAEDVNKDALICFEYVKEYVEFVPPEVEDVKPSKTLTPFADQDGEFIDADLDGSFVPVKGNDGYYYVDGKLVVVTLGTDDVTPRGLSLSFVNIYKQGQSFTFGDGKTYAKNYYPLVEAYSDASNNEGRYPLTDELIEFFDAYIENVMSPEWLGDTLNADLPEGKEWLAWCGYYYEAQLPEEAGTADDPITLFYDTTLSIELEAGGEVYYAAYTKGVAVTFIFTSTAENVKLTSYNPYWADFTRVVTEPEDGFFSYEITVDAMEIWYFVFSTTDGAAGSYSVLVKGEEVAEPDGSMDNPYVIETLGRQYGETTEEDNEGPVPVFYLYTVTEDDDVLYFYVGDNTVILSIEGVDESTGTTIAKTFDEVMDGLSVGMNTELTIVVSTIEGIGSFEFEINNAPRGTAGNPYILTVDEETNETTITIDSLAGDSVVYKVTPFSPVTYTFMSDSTNVKLLSYSGPSNYKIEESDEGGFYSEVTVGAWEDYYFDFSSKDGENARFEVRVIMTEAEPEEAEEGTEDNPIEITYLGEYYGEVKSVESSWYPGYYDLQYVYFTYTVTSADAKLYFAVGDNTVLSVSYYNEETEEGDTKVLNEYLDELSDGWALPAGTVIKIEVGTADMTAGEVSFTISNAPIPAED